MLGVVGWELALFIVLGVVLLSILFLVRFRSGS